MLSRCRPLYVMVSLVLAQQTFLALSTLSIALAGSSLALGNLQAAIELMIYFFVSSLIAFSCSAAGAIYAEKARRDLACGYVSQLIATSVRKPKAGSEGNKIATVAWMSGESVHRYDEIVDYTLEGASTVLNILLTLAVFFVVVDPGYASALAIALATSCLLVLGLRRRIELFGEAIQHQFLVVNTHVARLRDSLFCGTARLADEWSAP